MSRAARPRGAGIGRRICAGIALLCAGIGLALALGALLPANPGWREPEFGVTIFVETNGVHTGLVLPVAAAGVDWRAVLPVRATTAGRPTTHILVGWGQRDFFLNTPSWAELKPDTALKAAVGLGGTLLHVEPLAKPGPLPWRRPLRLRPQEYRRLAASLRRALPPLEGPIRPIPGYGADDVFVPAAGRYWIAHSCNEWTAQRLRDAGVKTGLWTPLAGGVMRWR